MNFYTGLNILASLPKYSQMEEEEEEELDLITFLQLMGNALSLINIYLDISANDDADEIDEDDADLELEILGFFQLLLASLNLFQVIIQHQDIAFFDEIRTAFIELLAPNEEVPRQPINFWPRLAARRSLFWWMTGFVPETLQEIVQEVAHDVRQPRNPAVKFSSSEKGLSSCLFIPNIMIFMIFDIESHQKNLFLEKNWKKKLTWWTKKLHWVT
jgi:hypothetical protein